MNLEPFKNFGLLGLGSIGGYLINRGWITGEQWVHLSAAIVSLAAFAYAWWKGSQTQVVAAAASMPAVQEVLVTSTKLADSLGPNVSKV